MKPLWIVYNNKMFGGDLVGIIFKNGDGKQCWALGIFLSSLFSHLHWSCVALYLPEFSKVYCGINKQIKHLLLTSFPIIDFANHDDIILINLSLTSSIDEDFEIAFSESLMNIRKFVSNTLRNWGSSSNLPLQISDRICWHSRFYVWWMCFGKKLAWISGKELLWAGLYGWGVHSYQ